VDHQETTVTLLTTLDQVMMVMILLVGREEYP